MIEKLSKKPFSNFQKLLNPYINKIKKIPWVLGKDAFLLIIIFILASIFFGEVLFYKYVFLVDIKEPEIVDTPIQFQENIYQSVLKEWQARENIFESSSKKDYINPFLYK